MSLTHWIATIIEVVLFVVILLAFIYEPALAKWEKKQGEKMLKAFKKMKVYRK